MIGAFVRHGTTVALLVVSVVLFGLFSYVSLPRESSPDIEIPFVVVTALYTGAAPQDVEGLVTVPLENELASLRDIKEMTSSSAEGVSTVTLEFEPDVDVEDALQKVRDRVSRAKPKLPDDVEDPIVREISFSDFPIVMITIAGGDEVLLKQLAEELQEDVTRLPGVLEANIAGGLEREIRVEVDPLRLAHYGLSLDDIVGAVRNENSNVPGGDVVAGDASVLVRVPGSFEQARDIETVAIKRIGDRPVLVRDVARVVDDFAERASYARMNGQSAVSLSVTKRPGANIIELASAVKATAETHAETWPEGTSYRALADQSKGIKDMVSELENNIISALILVVGVILFFMGVRNSLFIALAIPLSMLSSFMVLDALGFTLNMIVLFSLILALGMLVDNAIVVVENVYRHLESGKSRVDAAIDGTKEVAQAVAASTATTVAAFFPMVFWGGIMGGFMGFLPKTVIIVLVSSLVVAVLILPTALAKWMRVDRIRPDAIVVSNQVPEATNKVTAVYKVFLQRAIAWRWLALPVFGSMFVGTALVYALTNHGTEFFPATDPNRAVVSIRAPTGTDLEATDAIVRRVEAMLTEEPNIDVFVAESGIAAGGFGSSSNAGNSARITVDFLPDRNNAAPGQSIRVEPTPTTIDRLRKRVAEVPGAVITADPEEMGPPVGADVAVEVRGEDFHEVGMTAQRILREIARVEGVTDLQDDYRVGRPELKLRIDRGAAKRVGVSTAQIGNTVRTAVAGATATTIRKGDEEWDVVVRLDPKYRSDLDSVLSLRLPGREDTSPLTFPVPLSSVATYDIAGGTGSIRHVDQDLVVTIEGDVLDGYNVNAVQGEVLAAIDSMELAPGIGVSLAGSTDEQDEAAAFLGRAFLIAVSLILLVLVTQFDSMAHPFIILTSVVLSLIGVLWGLLLTGQPFGVMMTGIGVISLAGVVVNNAIVLLDYVEQLRDHGMSLHDALVSAGMHRFRPVMLTAITTVLGLLPMATGLSFDFRNLRPIIGGSSAQWWGSMAWAVIFGLSFATILTLVLVPTMYGMLADVRRMWDRLRGRGVAGKVAPAAVLLLLPLLGTGRAEAAPVTLDEAIAAAEKHNIGLAVLAQQTVSAESLRGQAWSTLSPKLIASGGYTVNENEIAFDTTDMIPQEFADLVDDSDTDPVVIQAKEFWSGNLTLQQTLFSATALPLLRGAYALSDAARLDEDIEGQRIRAGVARAHYALATARRGTSLGQLAVDHASHQLDLAGRREASGLDTSRATLQAELALSRAERELATAQEQEVAAAEAYARLTGLPTDSEPILPASPAVPDDVQTVLAAARVRPDIEAASRRARAAELQRNAQWWGWMPRVTGQFTYQYSENTGFSDDTGFWIASATAEWMLWDGGLRIAQAKDLAAQARIAHLQHESVRRGVEEEVRTVYERYDRASRAVEAVAHEVELATENLRLAERMFEAGSATWLEVETARLAQEQAELNAVVERMEMDLAARDLLVAMGRG